MQRIGALILHGTVTTYNTEDGSFTAFMDFQQSGAQPYNFKSTPQTEAPGQPVDTNYYTDQFGALWKLVRS